jgi:drug/metabolite transporter (DMT)-like permease
MFYRLLIGGLSLLLVAIFKKEKFWLGWHPFLLALSAGTAFSFDLFFWHRSILYVGPGVATILANFQVFTLAIIGILFLKERPSLKLLLSIPLAFIGLLLIVGINVKSMPTSYRMGILYGLLTAGCYTAVTLILHRSRRISKQLSPTANMAMICLFGAFVGSFEVWLSGESFAVKNVNDLILLIAYGIICSGVGWSLITKGLTTVSASAAGLALVLQPTCAFVWDMLFFNRPTTIIQICGAVLTLSAIYFGAITRAMKN